jgi:hypothetical protein
MSIHRRFSSQLRSRVISMNQGPDCPPRSKVAFRPSKGGVSHDKKQCLIAVIFFLMPLAVSAYGGILDGKTFVGKNGEIGNSGSETDEIKFANGRFYSVGCGKYGFGDAVYTDRADGDSIFLTADIYSDTYGRITYSGALMAMTSGPPSSGLTRGSMENPSK